MTSPAAPHQFSPSLTQRRILALALPGLAINFVGPVLAYQLVDPHVHSDVTALVVATAVPAAYTAVVLVWRRRLDPVAVVALGCFGLGLLLVIATGGNEFLFKIREDLWTGPLGLACLISLALRRPLGMVALGLRARRSPQLAAHLRHPGVVRIATVSTAVVGVLLLVHAAVMVILAIDTSTATFLALQRPISVAMHVCALAPLVWWVRHRQRSRRPLDLDVADPLRTDPPPTIATRPIDHDDNEPHARRPQ
jgi:hypothetical protein